jgi:hypothetical protein
MRASEVEVGPPPKHEHAFEELKAVAPELPRLHRGAEVMLDRPLSKDTGQIRRVTLGGTLVHPGRISPPGGAGLRQ